MDSITTPSCSKRKAEDVAEDHGSKRLKPDPGCEGLRQNGRPLRFPWISVKSGHLQKPISEEQLLELLHYSALGRAPGHVRRPSWCRLHRQKMLKAVSVAVVDHVSQRDFYEHYLSLPNLRTKYNTRVTLSSSSTNLVSEIFSSEVSVVHVPQRKQEKNPQLHKALRSHPVIAKFGTERRGLTAYLLSAEDMSKRNFPLKGCPSCKGFVCTDSDSVVTDSSPLFGLDCEMCLTDQGNELTRVSLVDSSGTCVLDQLVKPHNRIRNYLTQYSGVTAQMLKSVQTTLSEVQARIKSLLPKDAVLVGHSLENDLRALKMVHPHVIDSSLLYRRLCGQRFKLKLLAETVLQKQIQTEVRRGHDPCEDAVTALELVQYFIAHGPLKTVEQHLEELWGITMTREQQEDTTPPPSEHTSSRFSDLLQTCGHSVVFFGRRSEMALHLSRQQWLSSDRQVLQAFRDQPKCPTFSVLQFSTGQTGGSQAAARTQALAPLRALCVLFAGPFPPQTSEEDVRSLFCCCGPLRSVRIIRTAHRVHAELQFALAESAVLALSLNGLTLLGHTIKVQRPVSDSTLDVDVILEALQCDPLTCRLLYVTAVSPGLASLLHSPAHMSAHSPAHNPAHSPMQVNGQCRLREDWFMDVLSRFGPVHRITPAHTGADTQAYVEFESVDSRQATLSSSQDLLQLHVLLCPALTPLHLSAPAPVSADTVDGPEDRTDDTLETRLAAAQRLRKLDQRLGKVFKHLPEGTLSVVVLRGSHNSPGLCFVEVKNTS